MKELRIKEDQLIKETFGNVSTPGLGLTAPPNYFKERHEYTAVFELPYNISDVIGNSSLVVDVDVMIPDSAGLRTGVELIKSNDPRLIRGYYVKMNWTAAEAFCVSKGGHRPLLIIGIG